MSACKPTQLKVSKLVLKAGVRYAGDRIMRFFFTNCRSCFDFQIELDRVTGVSLFCSEIRIALQTKKGHAGDKIRMHSRFRSQKLKFCLPRKGTCDFKLVHRKSDTPVTESGLVRIVDILSFKLIRIALPACRFFDGKIGLHCRRVSDTRFIGVISVSK